VFKYVALAAAQNAKSVNSEFDMDSLHKEELDQSKRRQAEAPHSQKVYLTGKFVFVA